MKAVSDMQSPLSNHVTSGRGSISYRSLEFRSVGDVIGDPLPVSPSRVARSSRDLREGKGKPHGRPPPATDSHRGAKPAGSRLTTDSVSMATPQHVTRNTPHCTLTITDRYSGSQIAPLQFTILRPRVRSHVPAARARSSTSVTSPLAS